MIKKNKIKYYLRSKKNLYNSVRVIYSAVVHPDRLMRRKTFGNLWPNKTILIIRPNSEDGIQGLMSLLIQTARWIQYANENDYLPYIDFKTYKTQYYDGINNSWEFFFKQPEELSFDDVYRSKNVILSGVSFKKTIDDTMFHETIFRNKISLNKCHDLLSGSIVLTEEVKEILKQENENLHVEDCIGVFIRGTDYVKLKPTGEFRQPDIRDVVDKVKSFIGKYPGTKVFLVTEDDEYYRIMQKTFHERLITVSFDSFISEYNGKGYLSKTGLLNEDKKKRGIDYLVKMILLSKCRYLVSSITMGSIAAYCFNGGVYEDKYIFDLGYYE